VAGRPLGEGHAGLQRDRFGLLPLEFDGRADSIYHPFDRSGQRHMEYLRERGSFADVPLASIVDDFRRVYPNWLQGLEPRSELHGGDFLADVAHEPPVPL